ncbi:MAG: hypothetical protein IJZ36_02110 [Bacilli bacterium]|nr:hypothetical protein [Bacilli bacterium]
MKKDILTIISAIILGFLVTKSITKDYIKPISTNSELVYFIQYGVFSSYESMMNNTKTIESYIYSIIEDKYYVYLGFTQNEKCLEKLKGYFKDLKYNIYSKEIYLNNQKLLDIIPTYDALLLNVTSNESIKYILKQQLEKYKEVEKN